jgi:tRNA pseudouridine55 synthase
LIKNNISGWLNIYKPKGVSSAHVVSKIKHLLKTKVGHAGTLDPLAEGILPIALGEATKLTSYLVDAIKTYRFKIQFGSMTSTGDAEGDVVAETDHIPKNIEECRSIIPQFLGIITQVPSKYSAIKIDGHRAYDLARNNIDFEMKSREVHIYSLECLSYENGIATYVAECSKGTYIRTLAEDISKSLQSFGFVVELARLKVGIFNEASSVKELTYESLMANLIRIEAVLDDILELKIDEQIMLDVRCGRVVHLDHKNDAAKSYLTYENKLVAVGSIFSGNFKSTRVFNI